MTLPSECAFPIYPIISPPPSKLSHMEQQVCRDCKLEKPLPEFVADRTRPNGVRKQCKQCKREADRVYRKGRDSDGNPVLYPMDQRRLAEQQRVAELERERLRRRADPVFRSRVNQAALIKLVTLHPSEFESLRKTEQARLEDLPLEEIFG